MSGIHICDMISKLNIQTSRLRATKRVHAQIKNNIFTLHALQPIYRFGFFNNFCFKDFLYPE